VDDLSKQILQEIMRRQLPDMSHIKPPTESASQKMIKNLRAAAGTKADKSPEHTEWLRELLKGLFD